MLKYFPRYTVASPKAAMLEEECKTDKWKKKELWTRYFFFCLFYSLNQQTWLLKQFVVFRWQGFGIAKDHRPSVWTRQNLRQNSMQRKLKITFRSRCQSPCFSLFYFLHFLFVSPWPTQLTSECTLNMEENILCGLDLRIHSSQRRKKEVQPNREPYLNINYFK